MRNDNHKTGVISSILTELGVLPPEGGGQETMTEEQQEIIAAYRTGQMTEEQFQKRLSDDPGLANQLAQINSAKP